MEFPVKRKGSFFRCISGEKRYFHGHIELFPVNQHLAPVDDLPMRVLDFTHIVEAAWKNYDPSRVPSAITDISVRVSTNYVYKIQFPGKQFVIAKLSYFGTYEHFKEDHSIVNALAHALQPPYDRTISHSLMKDGDVYTYRHQEAGLNVWVVFYRPVKLMRKLPKRLQVADIVSLGRQFGLFHKACSQTLIELPKTSKTMMWDMEDLRSHLSTDDGKQEFTGRIPEIHRQIDLFLEESAACGYDQMMKMPVFVDWNSGNFSLSKRGRIYTRWDYDWFRFAPRVLDCYFMSRVVSDIGDQTLFSYVPDTLMEPRFMLFLENYHRNFPLTESEIRFIKPAFRFFILQYVIKYGNYFFHQIYASRLQEEAFRVYLPRLDKVFNADKLLRTCNL